MSGSQRSGSASCLSSQLAAELEELMESLPVGTNFTVPPSAHICYSLELFLPHVLRQHYSEWEKESLDGVFVARATKTCSDTAEFAGTCILISDQTITPFIADLQILREGDTRSVAVVRLFLGEPGGGALGISGPSCNSRDAQRLLATLLDRIDDVQWSYIIEKGVAA